LELTRSAASNAPFSNARAVDFYAVDFRRFALKYGLLLKSAKNIAPPA